MDSSFFAIFVLCGITFWVLIFAGQPVLSIFPVFTVSLTKIFDILIAAILDYSGVADYASFANVITFISFALSLIMIAAFTALIIPLARNRSGTSEKSLE